MANTNRMAGRAGIKIPVHSVVDVVKAIHDLGHTEQFKKAAADEGAFVTLHPRTVNFIKQYVADHNLDTQHPVAQDIAGGCPGGDPNQCPYQMA